MSNRITLNPLAHVDPVGSVLLPLLLLLSPAPFVFGWAKPVPFNPYYFRDRRKGVMIVGVAGPLANFALATACGVLFRLVAPIGSESVMLLLASCCLTNLGLGLFNLIPVPPLDGSRVMYGLLRGEWLNHYMRIERFGIIVVLILVWVLNFDRVIFRVAYGVAKLLMGF
jgi:Zn-dependent protease